MDDGHAKIEELQGVIEELEESIRNGQVENKHLSERIAAAMGDIAKQRIAYEEMAEEGIKAIREKERAISENRGLEERMEQMQDSFNEASLYKVKEQYLSQQVQVLNGEVGILSESKKKLLEERNGLRRKLKAREGEVRLWQRAKNGRGVATTVHCIALNPTTFFAHCSFNS